jgi:hypothetical protein
MESMSEAAADRVEPGGCHSFGEFTRLEDADMAAWALEVLVAQAQVEMFTRCGRDGNGDLRSGLRDAGKLAKRAAIVMDVFHDFGADDSIERGVGEGKMEGVALRHLRKAAVLTPAFSQILGSVAHRIEIEVEPDHRRAARERPEAMSPLTAARVEEQMSGLDIKPLEIDGE